MAAKLSRCIFLALVLLGNAVRIDGTRHRVSGQSKAAAPEEKLLLPLHATLESLPNGLIQEELRGNDYNTMFSEFLDNEFNSGADFNQLEVDFDGPATSSSAQRQVENSQPPLFSSRTTMTMPTTMVTITTPIGINNSLLMRPPPVPPRKRPQNTASNDHEGWGKRRIVLDWRIGDKGGLQVESGPCTVVSPVMHQHYPQQSSHVSVRHPAAAVGSAPRLRPSQQLPYTAVKHPTTAAGSTTMPSHPHQTSLATESFFRAPAKLWRPFQSSGAKGYTAASPTMTPSPRPAPNSRTTNTEVKRLIPPRRDRKLPIPPLHYYQAQTAPPAGSSSPVATKVESRFSFRANKPALPESKDAAASVRGRMSTATKSPKVRRDTSGISSSIGSNQFSTTDPPLRGFTIRHRLRSYSTRRAGKIASCLR